jgi:hypothetical protein
MRPAFFAVILAAFLLVASPSPAQSRALEVSSPLDFQVFQRDTDTTGLIHFSGSAPPKARLKVLVEGTGLTGPLRHHWNKLTVDKDTGAFAIDLRFSAGGFYIVKLISSAHGAPKQQITVPHVGIGEVFVIAGQSNSTNYGEEPQKVTSGLVSTFDGKSWRIADDPQPGTQDNSKKGSFAPPLATRWSRDTMCPLALHPWGTDLPVFGSGSRRARQSSLCQL